MAENESEYTWEAKRNTLHGIAYWHPELLWHGMAFLGEVDNSV
ncbi:MAG TPA: hypothetical protein VJ863_04545 [Sphaerochaeta sp.]|nr:hypothetical protein [Sphaerochaeta sp.]